MHHVDSTTIVDPALAYPYSCEIIKPFGTLDNVLKWCRSELLKEWRWKLVEVSSDIAPGKYIFYFVDERDLFVFTVKWS